MLNYCNLKLLITVTLLILIGSTAAQPFFVSTTGNDNNPGTLDKPFATLKQAQIAIRNIEKKAPVYVYLRGGTYFLDEPIVFGPEDSGSKKAPVIYTAYEGEEVVISGGVKLDLKWKKAKNSMWQAKINPGKYKNMAIDQLFVNGRRQILARFPNYDPAINFFGGYSAEAISPDRVKFWKDPVGGYLHALHEAKWGSKHYRIEGVNEDYTLKLKGGWQENRGGGFDPYFRGGYHEEILFVENIFEELDAPSEWYFDNEKNTLYLIPHKNVQLAEAKVIGVNIKQLFTFQGSSDNPVRHIKLKNLTFKHTRRIFMEPYERLLRGDWSIARIAAVFFEGTEDCLISNCHFQDLGGNAVFLSRYNRRTHVMHSRFVNIGESAICCVGDLGAVRSPAIEYSNNVPLDEIDLISGPKTPDYPAVCRIEDNLMHHLGLVGKQIAGVFMSMAEEIEVRHNTIYNIPRAAICVNDGCWGGHVIEYNDVFNTVRETGDHGPFNSWGRDRYWQTSHHGSSKGNTSRAREMSLLDNYKMTIIRYNRFAHPGGHSWGIDLDDGSSNYHVFSNLCLGMGVKLREGFYRRVENNIMINGFGGFHVWFENCGDVIAHNIIINKEPYQFIRANPHYAKTFDYNLFFWEDGNPRITGYEDDMTIEQWQLLGFDQHSLVADPMFVDPDAGDYRVKPGSPALSLGFQNFQMDNYGVYKPEYIQEANQAERTFATPEKIIKWQESERSPEPIIWLGATVKNLVGEAEKSAAGIAEETGVLVIQLPDNSIAKKAGFTVSDVIIMINGEKVHDIEDLVRITSSVKGQTVNVMVDGNPDKQSFKMTVK